MPLSSPLRLPLRLGLAALAARRGGVRDPAPPVNVSLPSIIGTPAVGSEVTANQGGWSGYPSISYAYQWRRDGVNISGATSQAYTIQAADYEASLTVVVSATNTEGGPVNATSPDVTVIGVAPVNTVDPAVSGSSGFGDVLTTTDGTWTGYPASFTYAYQWQRNGSNIGGATASTYTIVAGDSAASITCVVTATNAQGSTAQASNGITAQTFTAPVISGVPTISGTAEVGQLLTATAASVTGNPSPSRTWQWLRDGSNISGATSSTYTLVSADGGTDVSVRQTETNALGFDDAVSAVVEVTGSASVLADARILVDWSDAATRDGRFAVNENASGTPSGNLIAFPTGPITQESGQATPTRTNWYGAVTDPSGVTNNATRVQSTATNQVLYFHRPSLHAGLPHGPYTLRFRARSTPGSGSHAISFGLSSGYLSGTVQDLDWSDPANEAATTFTREFTFSGSGDIGLRITASGADIIIDRVQLYPGTEAGLPSWASEVFTMGRPPYSWPGALALDANSLVDNNSSVSGMLLIDPAFPARHTYNAYTIISVNSLDSQSASLGSQIMNVYPNDGGDSTGNVLFGEATSPYTGEVNTFPSGTRSQMAVQAVGKGLIAIGQSRDSTTRKVYIDTVKTFESAVAFSGLDVARWTVGSWTTTNTASLRSFWARGKFAFSAVWDRALSEEEYRAAVEEMRARLSARTISMAQFDWHVISGDSNSTRANNDWSQLVTAAGYHSPDDDMLAMVTSVGGQGIDNIDGAGNRFDLIDGTGLLRGTDNGRTSFYNLCIGTNDWDILDAYSGTTAEQAAQYVTRVQALIQRALDLHPRVHVIWYSLLPQTATNRPNWEAQRLEVNNLMRTWIAATSRVHICDVGGSATIGDRSLQAGGGGTYYLSDEIHLSAAGDVEFAAIVRTSLATARAAAGL